MNRRAQEATRGESTRKEGERKEPKECIETETRHCTQNAKEDAARSTSNEVSDS